MRRDENSYWREAPAPDAAGEPRDLLENMLSQPVGQAGSGFSLEREVAARPLLAFGAAVVAGYLLGSIGDDIGAPSRRGHHWLSSFDDELDLLKSAALAVLANTATQNVRELVPGETGAALSSMLSRSLPGGSARGQPSAASWRSGRSERAGSGIGTDTGGGFGGQQTSSAPNTSFDTGAGRSAIGHDSPPEQAGSVSLTNSEVQGVGHLDPYYPPGGAEGPIGGGATPGRERAEDTHEMFQDKPDDRAR